MNSTTDSEKKLFGRVEQIERLGEDIKSAMFVLMHRYYLVERPAFFADLSRKSSVILLEDHQGILRGFTSIVLFDLDFEGSTLKILFSGDTIIQPEYWGSLELPRVWGRFMYESLLACGETPLYWFLISSGYKTYRFLPTFFKEFYPRYDCDTPQTMQRLIAAAATHLFTSGYDQTRGIIRLEKPTPLRSGISDPTPERQANPHVAFFLEKNQGHAQGEELACIARLHPDNFKAYVMRMLKRC